jgi:hypothetical protein
MLVVLGGDRSSTYRRLGMSSQLTPSRPRNKNHTRSDL